MNSCYRHFDGGWQWFDLKFELSTAPEFGSILQLLFFADGFLCLYCQFEFRSMLSMKTVTMIWIWRLVFTKTRKMNLVCAQTVLCLSERGNKAQPHFFSCLPPSHPLVFDLGTRFYPVLVNEQSSGGKVPGAEDQTLLVVVIGRVLGDVDQRRKTQTVN
jgi:hypothetical protein